MKLAEAAARALVAQNTRGRPIIDRWLAMKKDEAPTGTSLPFLPMVAVMALGVMACQASDANGLRTALRALHDHADDGRREVRDAVVAALVLPLQRRVEETIEALHEWMDGYFHASLVLQALSEPTVVQQIRDGVRPMTCLQEAFALAAGAPRSHQRSHGYRELLRALREAIAAWGGRFPNVVAPWLAEHADVATKDLLSVLGTSLEELSARGMRRSTATSVYDAIDAVVPPPRDPRWDVGPTRGRGKKARRKGRLG